MRHILRIVIALIAGLLAGALCAQVVAIGAMIVLGSIGPMQFVVLTIALAHLVLVPVASGLPLGVIAPRWPFSLAVATTLLIRISPVGVLGDAGVPRGWQIVQYLVQM